MRITPAKLAVIVVGGGMFGLWQAFEMARRCHAVTLREAMPEPDTGAASRFAGVMLAPECEAEAAPPIVRELGLISLKMWREAYSAVVTRGTLVVASVRDLVELQSFGRMTQGHGTLTADGVAALEPELAGRHAHIEERPQPLEPFSGPRRFSAPLRPFPQVGANHYCCAMGL